jgi:hypothetical protein
MFLGIVVTTNSHGAFTPAFVFRGRNNERIAPQLITQFTKVLVSVLHDRKERHVLEGRKTRRKEGRKEGREEGRKEGRKEGEEVIRDDAKARGVGGGLR